MLNLITTASRVDDPQDILVHLLVRSKDPALIVSWRQLLAFVEHVRDPSPALAQDLDALRSHREGCADPVALAIKWIYFATQQVHVFGWFRDGARFVMERRYPVSCYASYNVPCAYAWFNLNTVKWAVSLQKHTLPEDAPDFRVSVRYPGDGGTVRYNFGLRYCNCTPTRREPTLVFDTAGEELMCDPIPPEAPAGGAKGAPYVLLLTTDLALTQTLMVHADGHLSLQPVLLHSILAST